MIQNIESQLLNSNYQKINPTHLIIQMRAWFNISRNLTFQIINVYVMLFRVAIFFDESFVGENLENAVNHVR